MTEQACVQAIDNEDLSMGKLNKVLIPIIFVFTSIVISTLSVLHVSPLHAAQPSAIKIVMDDNYPPYVFRDETGVLKGIIVDQWKLWEQKTGVRAEVTAMDWGEAQHRMQAGGFDVIDTMFRNEQREKIYEFTKPYVRLDVPLFFHNDISGIRGPVDVKGFLVAAKEGDAVIDFLQRQGVASIQTYPSYEKLIQAAKEGKAKVFTVDKPPAHYFLHKFGIDGQFRETEPMYSGEFHRAVLKGNERILNLVESGFARITAGEYRDIDERWMGKPILSGIPTKTIAIAIAVACGVLAILVLWNFSLKVVIRRRTKELAESRQHFQAIYNSVNDAIFIHDLDTGAIIDVNMRMCEMFGVTRDEALSLSVGDISSGVSPYAQEDALRWLRRAAAGQPQLFEWQCRHKDGHLFWVEVNMRRATVGHGDAILVAVRDINERKLTQTNLMKSETKYSRLYESMTDAYAQVDMTGRIVESNPAFQELTGYTNSELKSLTYSDLTPSSWRATEETILREQVLVRGYSDIYEKEYIRNDGSVLAVELRSFLLRDDNGLPLGMWAIIRDITERKKAENALRESNDKIMGLVNSVPGYVAFVNADTLTYEFINSAFETGFGIPRDTIVGSYVKDIIGDENFNFALKFIETAKSGKPVSYENTFKLTSGKRWIQVNYNPIKDANGHVSSIVVHSFDITDIKEHESERLKIEKLESLGVLAGGIAHDFNNILTGILGNISLARQFVRDPFKLNDVLEKAEKASVRATDLSRQLLTFAKGGEPFKKAVSVQHAVQESASLVLHGSNVKCVIDIPDSLHAIEADEGQISQVLHNLIINATQAMPGGGILTVSARNETMESENGLSLLPGPYIRIAIADEGCGIPENLLSKIFDPYFTTKVTGSGLGLASAHSIISRHNGHIGVSSAPGKGTTFTIHLPSTGENVTTCTNEDLTPATSAPKGGTILVLDDEEIILDLASAMLQEIGYDVETCHNGKEALERYRLAKDAGTPFSAVIMDLTIPGGMGGKEVGELILAYDPDACLIVSSGYSDDPIISKYNTYGFKGALAKPYRLAELTKTIQVCLRSAG